MTAGTYTSELAEVLAQDALERFLRYVRIDTQSDSTAGGSPSTAKQLDLSRILLTELAELGLDGAQLTEHGYVFATLPATVDRDVPTIGFVAHVDTSPEVSGANVEPQVVRYDGEPLPLPGDPRVVLSADEMPELEGHAGCTIVTTDGTTLLGADDKAGVAEIMAAIAYLTRNPDIEHGTIKVAFTPDEEIGQGTDHFDIAAFGADAAYTLDGSSAGEIQDETFGAIAATVVFHGRNVHPGSAKGTLVSAIKLAGDFVARLPRDTLSPETTELREGFVHPVRIEGEVDRCSVQFIVRDFDEDKLAAHEQLLRDLAAKVVEGIAYASADVDVRRQYRNMKEYLKDHPRIIEAAEEAIRRAGLEPRRALIRGGTHGAMLSEKGLPTPNLFTGGHEYHSLREWICVHDMGAAVETIVHLAQIWAE